MCVCVCVWCKINNINIIFRLNGRLLIYCVADLIKP